MPLTRVTGIEVVDVRLSAVTSAGIRVTVAGDEAAIVIAPVGFGFAATFPLRRPEVERFAGRLRGTVAAATQSTTP